MKFTKKDIEILKDIYDDRGTVLSDADIEMLEDVASITKYSARTFTDDGFRGDCFRSHISRKRAIEILGKVKWFRGLVHSTLYGTDLCEGNDSRTMVMFFTLRKD